VTSPRPKTTELHCPYAQGLRRGAAPFTWLGAARRRQASGDIHINRATGWHTGGALQPLCALLHHRPAHTPALSAVDDAPNISGEWNGLVGAACANLPVKNIAAWTCRSTRLPSRAAPCSGACAPEQQLSISIHTGGGLFAVRHFRQFKTFPPLLTRAWRFVAPHPLYALLRGISANSRRCAPTRHFAVCASCQCHILVCGRTILTCAYAVPAIALKRAWRVRTFCCAFCGIDGMLPVRRQRSASRTLASIATFQAHYAAFVASRAAWLVHLGRRPYTCAFSTCAYLMKLIDTIVPNTHGGHGTALRVKPAHACCPAHLLPPATTTTGHAINRINIPYQQGGADYILHVHTVYWR